MLASSIMTPIILNIVSIKYIYYQRFENYSHLYFPAIVNHYLKFHVLRKLLPTVLSFSQTSGKLFLLRKPKYGAM